MDLTNSKFYPRFFPYLMNCFDLESSEHSLEQFCQKIISESENVKLQIDEDHEQYAEKLKEERNCLKGFVWEIFSYLFFSKFEADARVNMKDYELTEFKPHTKDMGVDGTANRNGNVVVVQCKFRSNPIERIKYDDMKSCVTDGWKNYGLVSSVENNIVLFTNCQGVDYSCADFFKKGGINNLVVYGFDEITKMVGIGNHIFWNWCFEALVSMSKTKK